MTATAALGQGSVYIKAVSGTRKAESRIAIPVLAANPRITETLRADVGPGESREIPIQAIGLKGTNDVTLEFSQLPPFNLQKRLQFLIQYPHGCLEQTLSTAFPQLYLKYLVKLDAGAAKKSGELHCRGHRKNARLPGARRRLLLLAGRVRGPSVDLLLCRLFPAGGVAPGLPCAGGHA